LKFTKVQQEPTTRQSRAEHAETRNINGNSQEVYLTKHKNRRALQSITQHQNENLQKFNNNKHNIAKQLTAEQSTTKNI
jgi:hypothetical protein